MENKTVFALLTFFFNQIGIPYFVVGNSKKGIFAIITCFITLGILGIVNAIKGIILAIKIFKMSDEEFAAANKAELTDGIVLFYKD